MTLTTEQLRPPFLTINRKGDVTLHWSPETLSIANRSLLRSQIGTRIIESDGAEYVVEEIKVLGRAPGSLLERLFYLMDPLYRVERVMRRTGAIENLDELKKLLVKSQILQHLIEAGSGTARPFRDQIEAAEDVGSLFAVLRKYLRNEPVR